MDDFAEKDLHWNVVNFNENETISIQNNFLEARMNEPEIY